MHLLTIPIILLLPLSLLPTALSSTSSASSPPQQTSLTLHIPPTIPALHHSTRAFLTTHSGFSLIAPLTRAQSFVFNNLTLNSGSESYNLDIGSREYDFAPMVVVVRGGDNKQRKIEVLRRGGVGEVKRREEGGWEVRVIKARDGWDERSGFNPMSLLKNPMILLGLVGFAFVIGMPYVLDTMDPETRAEFEEQQKKSILNTANRGAATSLQNFDMAAWMAGKTSSGAVANTNEGAGVASSSSKIGAGAGAGGEGKGEGNSGRGDGAKTRRRG